MTNRVSSAVCALVVAMMAAAIPAPVHADDPSLEVIAAWGGPVNAAHVEGGIAYLGSGRRLVILNVSDINNFIELAALDLGNTVQDLAVRDGYAFVVTRTNPNAFCVVDVSTPSKPALVWSSSSLSSLGISQLDQPRQVQLRGDYAYVRVGSNGGDVRALNIANPRNPSLVGAPAISFTLNFPINDFAIAGDFAYVAASAPGPGVPDSAPWISIHDLAANPAHPPQVGSLLLFDPAAPGGEVEHLDVAGDYVYALAHYGGVGRTKSHTELAVIDVSNPGAPTLASDSIQFQSTPLDLAAEPGRLYIANSPYGAPSGGPEQWAAMPGLLIYDIAANPAAPAFIKSYKTHGAIHGVQPTGAIAWLFDAGEGLIALDVTNPASPVRRDNYHSPAYLKKMDKVGNRLYVTDLWNGFTILNVANPAAPQVLGVYRTPMTPPPFGKGTPINNGIYNWGIEIRDNRAYLAAGYAGIHVVNVANPANPTKLGGTTLAAFPGGHHATAIELDGDFAHLGIQLSCEFCGGGFYKNFNITDISPPIILPEVGSLELLNKPNTIATRQGYSYLAMGQGALGLGVTVIDTTVPSNPFIAFESTAPNAYDLAISGDLLHVAGGIGVEAGLHLYGLAQRDVPDFDGFYPMTNSCAVAIQDQRAYVVGSSGCLVLDVTDPDQPQPLAAAPNVGVQEDSVAFVDEPYVFITSARAETHGDRGLEILKLEGCLDSAGDADLTCDGVVNGFDLAALLSEWTGSAFYSPCPPHIPADLSHDCRVNGGDLAILLGDWG